MGAVVIALPLPPGCLPTLWEQDGRMRESYLQDFPGFYKTSDAGTMDAEGYVFLLGRTDDIINCAGHRLSTGGMEEVLASLPDVAECAVIGINDPIKGEVPCGFLVLKAGVATAAGTVEGDAVALIRDRIGPVASFKTARHDEADRRRPVLRHAGDHRGPGDAGHDSRGGSRAVVGPQDRTASWGRRGKVRAAPGLRPSCNVAGIAMGLISCRPGSLAIPAGVDACGRARRPT